MKFRFADEALAESISAGQYYNRQVAGLGDAFLDEVETGIQQILDAPLTWRVVERDVRRYLVVRFPYGIYYTLDGDTVVIWAIRHLHRNPDYRMDRRPKLEL